MYDVWCVVYGVWCALPVTTLLDAGVPSSCLGSLSPCQSRGHSHNRRRHDDDVDSGEEGDGKDDTRVNNDDFDYESWKTSSLDQYTSRSVNDDTV